MMSATSTVLDMATGSCTPVFTSSAMMVSRIGWRGCVIFRNSLSGLVRRNCPVNQRNKEKTITSGQSPCMYYTHPKSPDLFSRFASYRLGHGLEDRCNGVWFPVGKGVFRSFQISRRAQTSPIQWVTRNHLQELKCQGCEDENLFPSSTDAQRISLEMILLVQPILILSKAFYLSAASSHRHCCFFYFSLTN